MTAMHPVVWVIWLAAITAILSATRNPLHLSLALLAIALVHEAACWRPARPAVRLSPLRFALFATVLAALLNMATVRYGDTVLFRVPDVIPLLGGPVTLEALVYGALSGLVLAGVFTAFAASQRDMPTGALLGLIPGGFYPLAVVAAIAITFVPATVRQAQQIREAQAIRGHRLRGLRDWLPLAMPLLIGGLERALQLAEALASRGFGGEGAREHGPIIRLAIAGGLAVALAGWVLALAWGRETLGALLMLAGVALVCGAIWVVGRRSRRTRYRQVTWRSGDTAVVIAIAVTLAAWFLPLPGIDGAALAYNVYPRISLPRFDPVLGFATLGLAWPVLVLAYD